jgi:hypothetical protein
MVYIPTWLDMLLLLTAFIMTATQHYLIAKADNTVMNARYGLMAGCSALMALTAFLNRRSDWISLGLFLTAVLCLAAAIHLHRKMPPKERHD